jgi:hypothetical protein
MVEIVETHIAVMDGCCCFAGSHIRDLYVADALDRNIACVGHAWFLFEVRIVKHCDVQLIARTDEEAVFDRSLPE